MSTDVLLDQETVATPEPATARTKLVVMFCAGLLFGALLVQIKENVSSHYHPGPMIRCFDLKGWAAY